MSRPTKLTSAGKIGTATAHRNPLASASLASADSRYGKIGVIGAIERKGNVVARVIGSQDAPTLRRSFAKSWTRKSRLVVTDENKDYNYVDHNLPHESVKHSAGEYVRGEVHTNSIESFWSLLKRGVMGTYHNVSAKYLPFYLNEFSFRFNNRNNEDDVRRFDYDVQPVVDGSIFPRYTCACRERNRRRKSLSARRRAPATISLRRELEHADPEKFKRLVRPLFRSSKTEH